MVALPITTTLPSDDIHMDAEAQRDKEKVLKEQHKNSRFYSIAETFQFLAAAMLPVGLGLVVAAIKAIPAGTVTVAAVSAAFTAPATLIFLGAAAICTGVAICSRYKASKHFHNATFNATELNAQHTAKYLVQEIKRENACVQQVEHEENCRADGKAWTQALSEQPMLHLARN